MHNISISGSSSSNGNAYGIFLRDDASVPEWTSDASGVQGPWQVTLEHVNVCNVTTDASLITTSNVSDLLTTACNKLNYDNLQAIICTLSAGAIKTAASDLLSQLMTLESVLNISKNLAFDASALTTAKTNVNNAITTLLALLTSPSTSAQVTLKAEVLKTQSCMVIICNLIDQSIAIDSGSKDYVNGTTNDNWNAYGIRIVNGHGIALKDCNATDTTVTTNTTTTSRASAIALDKCKGSELYNCSAHMSSAGLGSAIGFSIATNSESNTLYTCSSTGHFSINNAFGYWVCNSNCQTFIECEASANNVTRTASSSDTSQSKGFYFENSSSNHAKQCFSSCHSCTLNAATEPAEAIGFESSSGSCNVFDSCHSHTITADTASENTTYQATLIAAGFYLNGEANSIINNSIARCCEGSAGISAGIFINNSTCSTVRNNTLATNTSKITSPSTVLGNGYGIYDNAANSSSFIVENIAYANQTLNYKVTHTTNTSNETLPLATATYGDMTGLYAISPWVNISLHANPGATGCNDACTTDAEQ